MKFEMLKDKASIIKVIGVGGGGGNAINHMYRQGINGVDFIVCNTDAQALELSPIPNKVQLGSSLTEGRGAGSIPEVGKNSAIENIDQIKDFLGVNTKMVFITAGMGGGTGTGASPIIAQAAKELGILTVGIVTTPFGFEGKRRKMQADEGLAQLKKSVDTLLVISNDKLRKIFGNLSLSNAFAEADNVLTTAAKGIAEIITLPGYINVDFEDVRTVMTDGGVAIMGSNKAEGEQRARKAVEGALSSPLLNDNQISGARYILLNITSGNNEVLLEELTEITDYIQEQAGLTADMIWGHCYDESLGDSISVTIIATGFMPSENQQTTSHQPQKKEVAAKESMLTETKTVKPLEEPELLKQEMRLSGFSTDERTGEPVIKQEENRHEPRLKSEEPFMGNAFKFSSESFVRSEKEGNDKSEKSPFSASLKKENTQRDIFDSAAFEIPETSTFRDEVTITIEPVESNNRLDDDVETPVPEEQVSIEEQLRRSRERIMRLKDLSLKLRSSSGLAELENEPAYKRKNKNLDKVAHSSETQMSRFTVSDDDGEIRPNNSFLHDNVD